jgi:hypothetical protein
LVNGKSLFIIVVSLTCTVGFLLSLQLVIKSTSVKQYQ